MWSSSALSAYFFPTRIATANHDKRYINIHGRKINKEKQNKQKVQ